MKFYFKIFISLVLMLFCNELFCQKKKIKEKFDKINVTDKNALRQGFWRTYFGPYKQCVGFGFQEGYYYNDKRIGNWIFYDHLDEMVRSEHYYSGSIFYQVNLYSICHIKSEGKYFIRTIKCNDTIYVTEPKNGKESRIIRTSKDEYIKLDGWKYYFKDGTEAKKEDLEEDDYSGY